jgi:hypothetical protein
MNAYFVDVTEFNVRPLTQLPLSGLNLPQMTSAQAVPDAWNTCVKHPPNIHPHPLSDSRALIA